MLTPQEGELTRQALLHDPRQAQAKAEAQRIAVLAGHWEAMAVEAAMRTAADHFGDANKMIAERQEG